MKADPGDIDVIEVAALVEDYAKAFPKPYAVQWDELGETRQENFDTEAEACAFKRGMLLAPRPWVYVDCIAPVSMNVCDGHKRPSGENSTTRVITNGIWTKL